MILRELRKLPPLETALLVLAALVLIVLGVAQQRAQAPAPLSSYSTYDAKSGGTRAFYELLQREGVHASRFEEKPAFLDAGVDTLVYVEPLPFDPVQEIPTASDVAALDDWIQNGGRLLYVGHDNNAAKSKILGMRYADDVKTARATPHTDPSLVALGVGDVRPAARLRWRLRGKETVLYADARGPLAIRYARGKGEVVALSDEGLIANDGIAKGDNARFLVALALPRRDDGVVAIDEVPHGHLVPPHWYEVLPRPLVVAIGLTLAALAIAFAGAAVRFGPPLLPVSRDTATTADFIGALSGLLLGARANGDAAAAAADSTSRAIARSLALRDDATPEEIAARIERDDLRVEYAAMLASAHAQSVDDKNLVRAVALAQHLRKELASHGTRRR